MRADQYIGLNDWARNYLDEFKVNVRVVKLALFDDGVQTLSDQVERVPLYKVEVIGHIEGAWDSHVADLHKYTMPDGTQFEEYVQASPWSSGPCYFIALRSPQGTVCQDSLWTGEELAVA